MIPDTQGNDALREGGGGDFGNFADDVVVATEDHENAEADGKDEADDLVAGEGGDEAGEGEEGAANEKAPEVAREDGEVVGAPKVVDGEPDGKGEGEGDEPDGAGGEVFADDGGASRERVGAEELDGAGAVLVRPEAHAQSGDEEHVNPRMPEEERPFEIGVAEADEAAKGEGEAEGEEKENDDDGVGDGVGEVAFYFALEDGVGVHLKKGGNVSDF